MVEPLVVYICGSGHSGSTLLDMLLGGHPMVSALGEVHRLSLAALREDGPFRCSCGASVRECFFWQGVLGALQEMLGTQDPQLFEKMITTRPSYLGMKSLNGSSLLEPIKTRPYSLDLNQIALVIGWNWFWRTVGILNRDIAMYRKIIRNSLMIYQAVRRAWNTQIIVDSTKNASRLKGLYVMDKQRFKAIYLLRDGRAVTYSRMLRQNMPMDYCARVWVADHRKLRLALLTVPKDRILWLKYEDLCRDPIRELTRICTALGINFHPAMLDFRNARHNIGGNPMRFRSGERQILLDENWRRELRMEDREVFERIAGGQNRKFGYTD